MTGVARTGEISLADGRIIRLAGIDWPPPGKPAARARLRSAIIRLAEGAQASTDATGRPDRWGRLAGQVILHSVDGPPVPAWLQETLISLGLVRAWPENSGDPCWARLLAAENQARREQRGVWSPLARRSTRLRPNVQKAPLTDRAVIESRVRSVRTGRSMTFINLEGRRAETPSLVVRNRDLPNWRKEGLDPATFSGKRLRVRGVLSRAPALRIDLAGPWAVEILE